MRNFSLPYRTEVQHHCQQVQLMACAVPAGQQQLGRLVAQAHRTVSSWALQPNVAPVLAHALRDGVRDLSRIAQALHAQGPTASGASWQCLQQRVAAVLARLQHR